MEVPSPLILRQTAIRDSISKGLRPEAAETLYDLAENASSLIAGTVLAVLVSLFCDDDILGHVGSLHLFPKRPFLSYLL